MSACLTPTMEAERVSRGSFPGKPTPTGHPAGGGHRILKHEQMEMEQKVETVVVGAVLC